MKNSKGISSILLLVIIFVLILLVFGIVAIVKNHTKSENTTGTKTNVLADLVQVGDFVNYDAGTWTQEEIDLLKEMYQREPSEQGKFGGFNAEDSRNTSITPHSIYKNTYNGWRVLKVEDDCVYLIHAGTPEKFFHKEGQSFNSEKILTGSLCESTLNIGGKSDETARDWSMYVNSKYAESATVFTKEMLDEWGKQNNVSTGYNKSTKDDLIKTGSWYWLGQSFNSGFVWRVGQSGLFVYYIDAALGVRPVVKLKQDMTTSGQKEEIVGIDGTTTKQVWQLN